MKAKKTPKFMFKGKLCEAVRIFTSFQLLAAGRLIGRTTDIIKDQGAHTAPILKGEHCSASNQYLYIYYDCISLIVNFIIHKRITDAGATKSYLYSTTLRGVSQSIGHDRKVIYPAPTRCMWPYTCQATGQCVDLGVFAIYQKKFIVGQFTIIVQNGTFPFQICNFPLDL